MLGRETYFARNTTSSQKKAALQKTMKSLLACAVRFRCATQPEMLRRIKSPYLCSDFRKNRSLSCRQKLHGAARARHFVDGCYLSPCGRPIPMLGLHANIGRCLACGGFTTWLPRGPLSTARPHLDGWHSAMESWKFKVIPSKFGHLQLKIEFEAQIHF